MASRNVPAPVSPVEVTDKVAAEVLSKDPQSRQRTGSGARFDLEGRIWRSVARDPP